MASGGGKPGCPLAFPSAMLYYDTVVTAKEELGHEPARED